MRQKLYYKFDLRRNNDKSQDLQTESTSCETLKDERTRELMR
jgi:hypothetical protein